MVTKHRILPDVAKFTFISSVYNSLIFFPIGNSLLLQLLKTLNFLRYLVAKGKALLLYQILTSWIAVCNYSNKDNWSKQDQKQAWQALAWELEP